MESKNQNYKIGTFLPGKRISLNALHASNLDLYWSWLNDFRIRKNLGNTLPISKTIIESWIIRDNSNNVYLEIWHNEDNKAIGIFKITNINWMRRKCSIGTYIGDPAYWKKGYATEASKIALNYIFGELNLHKVGTMTYESNHSAQKVLEKCGFTKEAEIKDAGYFEGKYYNDIYYSLFREDWEKGISI